ncbi:MAG: hypothetical protein NC253_07240 [Ruminococcus sp.]|nr:hypothetical protein [Ruminococcus sp.]MCM1381745.1 hypothetical protein [Muribaculaceae bacterium]MCM1480978.1 hypothetical protein [Muribaculaceae bacterium]
MKKLICVLAAIAVAVSQAIVSYADEINPIYASKEIQNDMQNNMYDVSSSYGFLFGTNDVRFDFETAIPVYYPGEYDKEKEYKSFSEVINFSERYAVPVYNSVNGEFLGLAKFGQIPSYDELPQILKDDEDSVEQSLNHAGEWELKSYTYSAYDENLLYRAANNSKTADNIYYVEMEGMDRVGLLYVSADENGALSEEFLDVSRNWDDENLTYVSGGELLEELAYAAEHGYPKVIGGKPPVDNEPVDYGELEEDTEWSTPSEEVPKVPAPAEEETSTEETSEVPVEVAENPKTGNGNFAAVIFAGFSAAAVLFRLRKFTN